MRYMNNIVEKIFSAILITVVISAYLITNPGLFQLELQNDDIRTSMHGLMEYYGYQQFEDDSLSKASRANLPSGYIFFNMISGKLTNEMVVPKLFQFICLLGAIIFSWKIGCMYFGYFGGAFSVSGIIISTWAMGRMGGGNPRAFAIPVYLALLFYTLKNCRKKIIFVSLSSFLFYPLALLPSLVNLFLLEITRIRNNDYSLFKQRREIKVLSAALLILLLLSGFTYIRNSRLYGGFLSYQEAKKNPLYAQGGRMAQLDHVPENSIMFGSLPVSIYYRENQSSNVLRDLKHILPKEKNNLLLEAINSIIKTWNKIIMWDFDRGSIIGLLIFFILPVLLYLLKLFKLPEEAVIYIFSFYLLYFISIVTAHALYHPSRYLSYPGSILVSQLFIIGFGSAVKDNKFNLKEKTAKKLLAIVFFVLLLFAGPGISVNNNLRTEVFPHQKKLFYYIRNKTSENSLFAGNLYTLNNLPFFAKRKVLINHELCSIGKWNKLYRAIVYPRIMDNMKAYFTDDISVISNFKQKYRVDYILIKKSDFFKPENFIFSPLNKTAVDLFHRSRPNWILIKAPDSSKVYEDPYYILVDLNVLANNF